MIAGRVLVGVVGCGGFGREVMPLVEKCEGSREGLVFVDDNPHAAQVNGFPVLHTEQFLADPRPKYYAIAVGDPSIREEIAKRFAQRIAKLFRVCGGRIIGGGTQSIGEGLIACTYSLIHPNCTIGKHAHLNIYSYVAHDAVLGDFVTLSPKAAINGHVMVGDGAYIGTGAITREGVVIGRRAIVGAGAVVIDDVPDGATVVGNPARVIKVRQLAEFAA